MPDKNFISRIAVDINADHKIMYDNIIFTDGSQSDSFDHDKAVASLRNHIILDATLKSSMNFRSPIFGSKDHEGLDIDFSYERSLNPKKLEKKINSQLEVPGKWKVNTLCFNSCMAALTTILQTLKHMLKPTPDKPIILGNMTSYFETNIILNYLSDSLFNIKDIDLDETENFNDIEIFFFETVRYDQEMNSFNTGFFLRNWIKSNPKPRIIIIDTTLTGNLWPVNQFLDLLSQNTDGPITVIVCRSGLKLDQRGMEITNLGICSIYTTNEKKFIPNNKELKETLKLVRNSTGASVPYSTEIALSSNYLFSEDSTAHHTKAVLQNNLILANRLYSGGIFNKVFHPSLSAKKYSFNHCPFIMIHLDDNSIEAHEKFLSIIVSRLKSEKINAQMGSSFGFCGHRFESFVPRVKDNIAYFKIAMGARIGSGTDNFIKFMEDISAYDSVNSLVRDYPNTPSIRIDLE